MFLKFLYVHSHIHIHATQLFPIKVVSININLFSLLQLVFAYVTGEEVDLSVFLSWIISKPSGK